MKKKLRPLGDILLDLEPLIDELTDQHSLQWSDILALIHVYLTVHHPENQEEYLDGSNPIWYYGPRRK